MKEGRIHIGRMTPAQPVVSQLGPRLWEVQFPYRRYLERVKSEIEIPAGFLTDFGSIPRVVWWRVAPHDLMSAPVIHDFLYREKKLNDKPIDRATADLIFRDVMVADGVSPARLQTAYRFVRMFGAIGWRWALFAPPENPVTGRD